MKSKLKVKRTMKDYNQAEVAELLGMTPGNYSKKEKGDIPWKVDEIKKLKDILDLTEEEVLDIFFAD